MCSGFMQSLRVRGNRGNNNINNNNDKYRGQPVNCSDNA